MIVPIESRVTAPQEQFQLCLMLHALRAGLFVWPPEQSAPAVKADKYVIIFGGTDVNVFSHDATCCAQMQRIIDRVDEVVCFSGVLAEQARLVFRLPKVRVIRQSCFVPRDVGPSPAPLDALLASAGRSRQSRVALLPGGIRKVKGQRFAIDAWSIVKSDVLLLLVGPVIEQAYMAELDLSSHSSVVLQEGVESSVLLTIMMDPRVVCTLNTSESEGQSQAVLESMLLRKPVVVRDIPANLDLVDSTRGFVVSDPHGLATVMNSWSGASNEMLNRASDFVSVHHSTQVERSKYRALLQK